MSGFLGVPVGAAYHLVFALTHLLTPVAGGLAAAVAIIAFTAAVRLLISPLSLRALRGQAASARLAPEVQALRKRHAGQPERLQRELASGHDAVLLAVLALLAGLCWLSARLARRMAPVPAVPVSAAWPGGRTGQDPAKAVPGAKAAGRLTPVLPYVTVVIAAFAPLAAALYLVTTVAWTLGERLVFLRRTAPGAVVTNPAGPARSTQRRQRGQHPGRPGSVTAARHATSSAR